MADLGAIGEQTNSSAKKYLNIPTDLFAHTSHRKLDATAADNNLLFPPRYASGIVKDASGTPAVRLIRAYARDTGAPLGETYSASDGTYSVLLSRWTEYYLVCLDDAAGTVYNDLILRTTPA